MPAAAILDFFRSQICNGPNSHESRTASLRQISLKSLKLWPFMAIFRFFKMAAAAMLDFWNYKVFTVGRIISVKLCHHAKFRGDWSSSCWNISILDFSRWWQPQSWISTVLHFNDPNGQEGRTASLCHILSKSLKPQRRYVSFPFFKMAATTILDFRNFKLLTVGMVKRVELQQHARFCQNRLNCGRDMAIFRFFKMAAPSWIFEDFWNFKFFTIGTLRGSNCIVMPNFVEIALSAADIMDFTIFQDGRRSVSQVGRCWISASLGLARQ